MVVLLTILLAVLQNEYTMRIVAAQQYMMKKLFYL